MPRPRPAANKLSAVYGSTLTFLIPMSPKFLGRPLYCSIASFGTRRPPAYTIAKLAHVGHQWRFALRPRSQAVRRILGEE